MMYIEVLYAIIFTAIAIGAVIFALFITLGFIGFLGEIFK